MQKDSQSSSPGPHEKGWRPNHSICPGALKLECHGKRTCLSLVLHQIPRRRNASTAARGDRIPRRAPADDATPALAGNISDTRDRGAVHPDRRERIEGGYATTTCTRRRQSIPGHVSGRVCTRVIVSPCKRCHQTWPLVAAVKPPATSRMRHLSRWLVRSTRQLLRLCQDGGKLSRAT